jgi:hypothetical protein
MGINLSKISKKRVTGFEVTRMGRNMQRLRNLPEVSQEEEEELTNFILERRIRQAQEIAKWRRREEPLASLLLREMLLDKIKPPGFQDLFKP